MAYWLWRKGFPLRMLWTCDIDIDVLKSLDKSTRFGHPIGIVIGHGSVIGKNCQISQGVTIGVRYYNQRMLPVIGNNVFIGTNAILLGNIHIGNNVKIGAGAIVLKSVPDGKTVVGLWK
jgi:serine O-acetyltransferase